MYADEGGGWNPKPWQPPPRRPRLTGRQERILMRLIALNVLFLVIAPIGGVTVIQTIMAFVAGR